MTELWPFIIVGALAIAAAVMMLLSDNPIHSALFLIVVMVCIAFMFLLLNASFLALIQITVYAGAIMVLFLFVIMLLGNEKLKGTAKPETDDPRRFRWFVPLVFALSLGLLFSFGFVVINAQQGGAAPPAPLPMVSVLNAWAEPQALDVYAGDEQIAARLEQGQSTNWVTVDEGSMPIRVEPVNQPENSVTLDAALVRGENNAIVVHGADTAPQLLLMPKNLDTVFPSDQSRLQFLNLSTQLPAVQVQERTVGFVETVNALFPSIAQGQASEVIQHQPMTVGFSIVDPDSTQTVLFRLNDYVIGENDSDLMVITDQRTANGDLRVMLAPFRSPAMAPFGSPQQMGYSLLTTFMLPFQVIGLLLLAALIGVIVLSQRFARPKTRLEGRRVVSRPLTSVIAAQVGSDVMVDAETDEEPPRLPEMGEAEAVAD
ncbi:MAG TPA: NADH-quinone oxidoreductase subunit J [Candidatus Limnocylindrales bacterium]|nr:NADH-quinone oxidoreductase subunit J [Candidatus Limnocylindrales bacterium]